MRNILIIISFFLLSSFQSVSGENKRLVCDWTDPVGLNEIAYPWSARISPKGLPIGTRLMYVKGAEKDYAKDKSPVFQELALKKREEIKQLTRAMISCKGSPYLLRYNYTIDTKDLNTTDSVNAEFSLRNCTQDTDNIVKVVTMTSTPSYLSFIGGVAKKDYFVIDRKTLKAGYGTDRQFDCKIEKIDGDNKI